MGHRRLIHGHLAGRPDEKGQYVIFRQGGLSWHYHGSFLALLTPPISMLDGNEYRGELHDKQRNGQGCMHFIDKSSYNGVWSNNKRHSLGQLTLPNGCMADLVYSHGKSFLG